MKEKTLRYPGHIDKMKLLRESGFFGKEVVTVNGKKVRPVDLTAHLLFPRWELKKEERDFTVMRVIVEGRKNGKRLKYTWDLLDRYDQGSGIHSMARTTGYTATVALRMVAEGVYRHTGITVPEYIGRNPDCVIYMMKGLKERGVVYRESVEEYRK